MADAIAVFPPGYRITDSNNAPVSGGSIEFYTEGLAQNLTVFSDVDLTDALGSTVHLNSVGVPVSAQGSSAEVQVYTGDADFGLIIKSSAGVTLRSYTSIRGATDTADFESDIAISNVPVIQKSADYTAVAGDRGKMIEADATGGSFTITLPDATASTIGDDWLLHIKATGTGSGTVTVAPAGGQTLDGTTAGLVLTYQYEGITVVTDGANWHVLNSARYHRPTFSVTPQGRLTPTTGTPVISADAVSQTSLFYSPFTGNLIPLYDGQRWEPQQFDELTLTLVSQHTANTIFDVVGFLDGTTLRIGTGPAWSTSTAGSGARGTGAGTTELQRVDGLWTNAVEITARNGTSTFTVSANRATYLGTIVIDGSAGQVTCHVTQGQDRVWGVWNAYNRKRVILQVGDSTASWIYSTSTIRQSRADTGNTARILCGLPEEYVKNTFNQNVNQASNESTTASISIGIGWNSTTAYSGKRGSADNFNSAGTVVNSRKTLIAEYIPEPFIGINDANCCEAGNADTTTFYGTDAGDMLMTSEWWG